MFELKPLPYAYDALEPVISATTMRVHHDKHHAKYVETLNELLAQSGQAPDSLEAVVRGAAGKADARKLFDNAAQAWNHAFFWDGMAAGASAPDGPLAEAIARDFGGLDRLKAAFVEEGAGHFASGWVWLASDGQALRVLSTHDADDLLTHRGLTPLITCDLWEHAYYLDHGQDRQGFLEAWFDALPNWALAGRQLAAACGQGAAWRHPEPKVEARGTAAVH
jgi:Fe-Mn family superoxide dismutase